ncbi:Cytosolic iron-sulfur protein assembly protein [Lithohypha guttulata]|uniref:Probable cytosolic iron-sulfur protein assembly protein 1 n=1 Tax=Lithohypha guttulata TaxID=1690604 RepID=A0AAN7T0H6_9EURO|nr:Cytosolic iron-sulfur protein assembly protein [Lithohypha guttulata]
MATTSLESIPQLTHHTTLHCPTTGTRTWSSAPHLSSRAPLLATATSDRSVNIWDMRSWRLLSTIAGGHKRSIRCVGWKDYGEKRKKRRKDVDMEDGEDEPRGDPVILASGSFDANCGLWVWNQDKGLQQGRQKQREGGSESASTRPGAVPGAFDDDDDMDQEQDFTNTAQEEEEDEEDWHFSTLLTGPDSEIKDLAFSPPHYGANLLATCSRDKSVWVWEEVEPEEWETVAVLGEHAGDVKCVTWLAGARTSRREISSRLRRRRTKDEGDTGPETGDDDDEVILGSRELLASGSYDDTIRLHHDDESEGDWITIAVLTGHDGTVWDVRFESYVNLASYPTETTVEEVIVDWAPRLISCSDDLTVKVWTRKLSEKETDEKKMRIEEIRRGQRTTNTTDADGDAAVAPPTGFSGRIPSTIRPPTSTEKWIEEATLPAVHVRSIYAVDWSAKTGLAVSCGGDGVLAVYKEVTADSAQKDTDVVMDGTNGQDDEGDIKKLPTEWKVVAIVEAAHDEYEVNHVCWAPKRDGKRREELGAGASLDDDDDQEEYIVSTGDDGQVKVWKLPEDLFKELRSDT